MNSIPKWFVLCHVLTNMNLFPCVRQEKNGTLIQHTHTHAQNHQPPYSSGMSGKARRDEVGWLVGRSVVERDWVFFRLVSIALNMQITFWWGIPRSNLFTFTILASKLLNIFMLVIYIDNEIPSHNFSYSSLALLTVAADSRMSVSKRKTPIK